MQFITHRRSENGKNCIYVFGIKLFSFQTKTTSPTMQSVDKMKIYKKIRRYAGPDGFHRMKIDEFYAATGLLPNEELRTLNQKIKWDMIFNPTDLKRQCADKILVRKYAADKIDNQYFTKILGQWDKASEIDFHTLPDAFVLKCNNGSDMNIAIKNKAKLDIQKTISICRDWLNTEYSLIYMEMQYYGMQKIVFAEEMLDLSEVEYKLYCFNGKVEFIEVINNKMEKDPDCSKCYDRDWNEQDFYTEERKLTKHFPRPDNLNSLISLSEKLAEAFAFVRVDWFVLKNKDIKFAEMTFSSNAGEIEFTPKSMDETLGKLWNIPDRDTFGNIIQ